MQKGSRSQSGLVCPRLVVGVLLCAVGIFLAMFSFADVPVWEETGSAANSSHHASPIGKAMPDLFVPSAKNDRARSPADSLFRIPGSPPLGAGAIVAAGSDWSIVPSPNARATETSDYLYGVACVSTNDCWAVGYSYNGISSDTLIERWDGTSWSIVASPHPGDTESVLNGVSCVSASDCWAVGYYFNGSAYETLVERWDGNSWAVVASPNPPSMGPTYFTSVTCVSTSECWAVGVSFPGSVRQTLIERWDGNSWAIVASPNSSPTQHNLLSSVTCVSASDCWAVGYSVVSGLALETRSLSDGTELLGPLSSHLTLAPHTTISLVLPAPPPRTVGPLVFTSLAKRTKP